MEVRYLIDRAVRQFKSRIAVIEPDRRGRGRWFRDNLQMETFGILQREGFGKLLQNQRPLYPSIS